MRHQLGLPPLDQWPRVLLRRPLRLAVPHGQRWWRVLPAAWLPWLAQSWRWLLLVPAVAVLLFVFSELALLGVGPTRAESGTSSALDTRSGYAEWVFAVLAPPATAIAEQVQQTGIGLFDPPPGPVPGEDFVPPAPTAEVETGVVVLITPTHTATIPVNRPPRASPTPSASPTESATPTATLETATPSPTINVPGPGDPPTRVPTATATRTDTPVPTATATATATATNTRVPTRTPTNTRVPTRTPTDTKVPTRTPTATLPPTATPTHTSSPTPTATEVRLGRVFGRVLLSSGEPLAGVLVSLGAYADTTGPQGWFNIPDVPYGAYTLTASARGCTFWPDSRSVTVDSPNNGGNNFMAVCEEPATPTSPPPTPTDTLPPPTPTDTLPPPTDTDTPVPPTATAVSTDTPVPTDTPAPTDTPVPTDTADPGTVPAPAASDTSPPPPETSVPFY